MTWKWETKTSNLSISLSLKFQINRISVVLVIDRTTQDEFSSNLGQVFSLGC